MTPTQIGVAIIGAIGTAVGAIVAIMRAGPDRTKAWVGTAADLVDISDGLRQDMVAHVAFLGPEVAALRTEVGELRAHQRERDGEMRRIRARNQALEDRVAVLERTLRTHDIPVPPEPPEH